MKYRYRRYKKLVRKEHKKQLRDSGNIFLITACEIVFDTFLFGEQE